MEGIRSYINKTFNSLKRPTVGKIMHINLDRADLILPDGTTVLGAKIVGGSSALAEGSDVPISWSTDPATQSIRPMIYGAGNTSTPLTPSEISGASYIPVEYGIPMANEFAKIHKDWLPIDYLDQIVIFSPTPPLNTAPGMFWIDTSV